MQSGIGVGLASLSSIDCKLLGTAEHAVLSRHARVYRGVAQIVRDTCALSALLLKKPPAYEGSPAAVRIEPENRTHACAPGTGHAHSDERIQDSAYGTEAHCKAAHGLRLRGYQ